MPENGYFGHFQACRKWPNMEVSSMHQTIKGDPRDGWDELKPDRSYLSHFPPWYSKSKSAPLKFPLKTTRSVKNYKHLKNDSNHENPWILNIYQYMNVYMVEINKDEDCCGNFPLCLHRPRWSGLPSRHRWNTNDSKHGDQHDMLVIVDDDDASKQGYQKKVGESDYLYPSLEYK